MLPERKDEPPTFDRIPELERRITTIEQRLDQLDRIEQRLANVEDAVVGLRSDFDGFRTDFAGFRAHQGRILERILGTLERLEEHARHPVLFRWPWALR